MSHTASRRPLKGVASATRQAKAAPHASKKAVSTAAKSARLEARINPELRKLVQYAAQLEGRKVSEFVTEALHSAARHAIAEAHVLRLSLADQELFAQALLTPPPVAPALKRAFARHRELVS